jgi:hypothetical protein
VEVEDKVQANQLGGGGFTMVHGRMSDNHNPYTILPLLRRNAPSLTNISLSINVSSNETMSQFFDLRFPQLRSLTLGVWHPTPSASIVDFMVAHSTLEALALGYDRDEDDATTFTVRFHQPDEDCLSKFTPNTLSKLQSFNGKTSCLRLMALAGLKCMETMTKLCVGSGELASGGFAFEYDSLIEAMEQSPAHCFSSVRELFFDTVEWIAGKESVLEEILKFAKFVGPSVQVWNGGLPSTDFEPWYVTDLVEIFSKFPKLQILGLRSLPEYLNEEEEEDVADSDDGIPTAIITLVKTCPLLECVYLHDHHLKVCRGWEIMRWDTDGSGHMDIQEIEPHKLPPVILNTPVGLEEIVEDM